VHSFGATYGMPWDIDNFLNSTFGELGGDTRVAEVAGWIDSLLYVPVPVPGAVYLFASGLASWRFGAAA